MKKRLFVFMFAAINEDQSQQLIEYTDTFDQFYFYYLWQPATNCLLRLSNFVEIFKDELTGKFFLASDTYQIRNLESNKIRSKFH